MARRGSSDDKEEQGQGGDEQGSGAQQGGESAASDYSGVKAEILQVQSEVTQVADLLEHGEAHQAKAVLGTTLARLAEIVRITC